MPSLFAGSGRCGPDGALGEPAQKTTAAPTPAPAQGPGIGDEVRDGQFAFTVTNVKCGVKEVGDQYLNAKAQGQFCLVSLTVKNIGDSPHSRSPARPAARPKLSRPCTSRAFYPITSSSTHRGGTMPHRITVAEELRTDTDLAALRKAITTFQVAKPTVSGSKGANAALTSLIAALVSLGLITDTTS